MEDSNRATASSLSPPHRRIARPHSRVVISSSIGSRPKRRFGSSKRRPKASAGSRRRRAMMPPQGGGSPIRLLSARSGAVPPGPSSEASGAGSRLAAVKHLKPASELVPHGFVERQVPLLIGREPVASEADLGQ